jgi:ABC-type oligopeptide transport system substrate-binding subunit
MKDSKTMEEVRQLASYAVKNGVRFDFYSDNETRGEMFNSSNAEIYADMSPTVMWYEIERKLQIKGINIFEKNFNQLKTLVEVVEMQMNS